MTCPRWPNSTYDLKRVGGYHTTVALGGEAALDVVAREPIDCVVLDLEMPGMNGFEVLRRLQQRDIDVPVIVYTGMAATTAASRRCGSAPTASSTNRSRFSASFRRSRTRFRAGGWPRVRRCGPPRR